MRKERHDEGIGGWCTHQRQRLHNVPVRARQQKRHLLLKTLDLAA